jgi:segregation and condensation protein A
MMPTVRTHEVKTAVFEGPLDLLLQLITSHQLEITAVSLVDLVDEYLVVIGEMERLDLEVTSEFVLIASTLIQLKARRLLPTSDGYDLDEELELIEERDRLLSRLLACVTFKDVAAVIAHRMEQSDRFMSRPWGVDFVLPLQPDTLPPIDASRLAHLATELFELARVEPDLDHLDLDLPSVADAMADLRKRVTEEAEADFSDLVAHTERPVEVIAYFLALLELARWGVVEATQNGWLAEIRVRAAVVDLTIASEWGESRE